MGCNLARGIGPLLKFMWTEQLWVAENLPELFPKFRNKAFMVGFTWKLTRGSVFGWLQWHQSFRDVSELKKNNRRRPDGTSDKIKARKMERRWGERNNEQMCDRWGATGMEDEKSKSWKPAKQRAWWLRQLWAFSTYWPIYTPQSNSQWKLILVTSEGQYFMLKG